MGERAAWASVTSCSNGFALPRKRELVRASNRTSTAPSSSRHDLCAPAEFDEGVESLAKSSAYWDGDEATASNLAADLSLGRTAWSLQGFGFQSLLVLTLSGSPLSTDHLEEVMLQSVKLQKLDASHCCLKAAPSAAAFQGLSQLLVLLLHKNDLALWEDIERIMHVPALQWLTVFENPIASQPEYRQFVIEQQPLIRVVDHWVVTDDERPGAQKWMQQSHGSFGGTVSTFAQTASSSFYKTFAQSMSRFSHQSDETVVPLRSHLLPDIRSPQELLSETQQELWALEHKCNRCSAACCIQSWYRGCCTRRAVASVQGRRRRAAIIVQRCARTFVWRQQMTRYLKSYLGEINELDLLLSAQEMLRLRAQKRIADAIRRMIRRRSRNQMKKKAAETINRCFRGFRARRWVIREKFEVAHYRKIYFPEEYSWEFLVMLNATLLANNMPPLPRSHQFDEAHLVGIRIPETDEVPLRQASVLSLVQFSQHCLVRPVRNNRYPQHLWDGPVHRIVDDHAPPRIVKAYGKIARRGANVDNQCRRVFLASCAPPGGQHPIDEASEVADFDEDKVSLVMKAFLEGPESDWPLEAQQRGTPLNEFMHDATRVGPRPRRNRVPQRIHGSSSNGATRDPETGLPCYRKSVWLHQRVMYYSCSSEKIVIGLLLALLRLSRSRTVCALVKPVPFLLERNAIEIAAATVIQATFRAHRVRCNLSCGLRTAVVIRRAALCIQRFWRWGLMKRRLEFLIGASKYVQAVRSSCLYIEERLLVALNVINSVDRYPPLLRERVLALGCYADSDASSLVLLRPDMSGLQNLKGYSAKEALQARGLRREGGLPRWLMEQVGDLQAVGPDDPALRSVNGVRGLLLEDIGERNEDHVYTATLASIKHQARLALDADDKKSSALIACAGVFRFVEMRFQSLEQARQRALLIYLCTFNSQHHTVVPLLSKSMLHDSRSCKKILQLWDLYGLTWQAGDRVSVNQLKSKAEKVQGEVIPMCGNQSRRHVIHSHCKSSTNDVVRKSGPVQKLEKNQEETCQKYAALAQQYGDKRQRALAAQQRSVQEVDIERFHEGGDAPAGLAFSVAGAMPPTTSERKESAPGALIHAEKHSAKGIIAAAKAQEAERVKLLHDAVVEARNVGKWTGGSEDGSQCPSLEGKEESKGNEKEQHSNSDWEERQKELGALLAFERAHMKAEQQIIAKSKSLDHAHNAADFARAEKLKVETAKAKRDAVKNHRDDTRSEAMVSKAEKREAQRMINKFTSKVFWIANSCAKHDLVRREDKDFMKARMQTVSGHQIWAERTAALAEVQHVKQEFRNDQVANLKQQLAQQLELRGAMLEEQHAKKSWLIKVRKSFGSLLKAASAEQMDTFRQGDAEGGARNNYQRSLDAFRELANEVSMRMQKAQAGIWTEAETETGDGAANRESTWFPHGWTKDDDEVSNDAIYHDDFDDIPEDWMAKLRNLHACHSQESFHKQEKLATVTLVPIRPSLPPSKASAKLPRGRMAKTFQAPSGWRELDVSDMSTTLPVLPVQQQEQRQALSPRPPLSRLMRWPKPADHDVAADTWGESWPTTGATVEEDCLVHRSLQSSKKASTATLSTAVPGTDSAKTLASSRDAGSSQLSSQKSLPPAFELPILPSTPRGFAAFRGNSRPPQNKFAATNSSVMVPRHFHRPRRAPFSAR